MLKRSLLALTIALVPLSAAQADWDRHDRGGRGHDRGYHRDYNRHDRHVSHYSRPRTVVSFNFGGPVYRPYPYPYYRPARVIYAPAPAVVSREVVYINNSNSREISSDDGRYCREYQAVSKIAGTSQQTYGTACMQPDGSWEIIS